MRNQEPTYETQLNDLTPLLDANDKSLQAVLSFYASSIDDLFHQRVQKIDEASAMLQTLPTQRKQSYRRIMRDVKAHLDERLADGKVRQSRAVDCVYAHIPGNRQQRMPRPSSSITKPYCSPHKRLIWEKIACLTTIMYYNIHVMSWFDVAILNHASPQLFSFIVTRVCQTKSHRAQRQWV
jgi:hypothetical protein